MQIPDKFAFLRICYYGPCSLAITKTFKKLLVNRNQCQKIFGMVDLCKLRVFLIASVHCLVVCKGKLYVNGLDVTCRVNLVVHVYDVRIVKTTHDVCYDSDLTDVGKEFVSQSFSL